ncbi:MAG: glycosyltransferase family 9 protein, partial [Ferrovibrionaceae bacterium]
HGIAWAARPRQPHDARRALSLTPLAPLLGLPGCEVHSLQLGTAAAAAAGPPVIDHQAELRAFDDTAALMSVLDLIISVDSAPVHLAGALGRPVWAMLYAPAEWRWGISGDTTPWYGSARLFRQQAVGEWAPVVARICAALADMLNRQSA